MADRQTPQQDLIQEGKNCRIRADSQRQRQDRYEREARILRQHPQAVSHVLPERVHLQSSSASLLQPHTVEGVPRRHVGENHFVSDFQPVQYLDRVYRASPQLYIDAHRFSSVIYNLENSDRARFLTVHRAAHEKHVLYVRDLYGSINAQIRPRTIGQWIRDRHIHGHRAVYDGGVDARNTPIDYSIPRVDRRFLTNLHILGLCFRNLDFRFEFLRISHPRQVCPWRDVLAHFNGHKL